jgi:hypothetical protein
MGIYFFELGGLLEQFRKTFWYGDVDMLSVETCSVCFPEGFPSFHWGLRGCRSARMQRGFDQEHQAARTEETRYLA